MNKCGPRLDGGDSAVGSTYPVKESRPGILTGSPWAWLEAPEDCPLRCRAWVPGLVPLPSFQAAIPNLHQVFQVTAHLSPHPPPASRPHLCLLSCPSTSVEPANSLLLLRDHAPSVEPSSLTPSVVPYRDPPPAPRHPGSPSPSPGARVPATCPQAWGPLAGSSIPSQARCLPQTLAEMMITKVRGEHRDQYDSSEHRFLWIFCIMEVRVSQRLPRSKLLTHVK